MLKTIYGLVLLLIIAAPERMTTQRPGLVFEAVFDALTEVSADVEAKGFSHSGNTTATVVEIAGERAVMIRLRRDSDAVPYRTELQPNKLPAPDFTDGMFAKLGHDYWYGIRSYMPVDWEPDKSAESIIQWHAQPDPDEAWRGSAVSLLVRPSSKTGEARMVVVVRADANPVTPELGGEARYDSSRIYDLGPVSQYLGKWSDWVWHIRWSYEATGNLQLWHNGCVILDLPNQGNTFNDAVGPFLKFGEYKWDWSSSAKTGANQRVIYFNDVRIGNSSANYYTVAPR
jgi:hypothetical protein